MLNARFWFAVTFIATLLLSFLELDAQNTPKEDYSGLISQAKGMGYSNQQILSMASSQGYTPEQLKMLSAYLELDDSEAIQEELNKRERLPAQIVIPEKEVIEEVILPIFGLSYFQNSSSGSLSANLKMPTPKDYILGPGDEVYVDIYGASEKYYTAKITPDGQLILANIGSIPMAGLTIEAATKRIKTRLGDIYTGINQGNTFLQVGLGKVRSINVHVVGEVNNPGTYTLSALSSILNIIHAASGVSENGTMREVKLFRSNKLIATFDLYEFLIDGQLKNNVRLESEDVILISTFTNRVSIKGEIKRPAFYEIKTDETLSDLIRYAGGFTPLAYTNRMSLERTTSNEKAVADILDNQFSIFTLKAGDAFQVMPVLERFTNRVAIQGAVMRPGNYALTENLTLSELIKLADGLRGDAVTDKVLLLRTNENIQSETITVSIKSILEGKSEDIVLKREDRVQVLSIYDTQEENYVKISGEVMKEGTYPYSQKMTIGDLLFLANGFKNSAKGASLELSRRAENQNPLQQTETVRVSIGLDFKIQEAFDTLTLRPFDHIMVRKNPNFFQESSVRISGEVLFPGSYAIISKDEKISDLIKRSGGLTNWAFEGGATLIRKTEYFREESEVENKIANLQQVSKKMDAKGADVDLLLSEKIDDELLIYISQLEDNNDNLASKAKRDRLEEIKRRNPLLGDLNINRTESIPLDLKLILNKPGSSEDLILNEGDVIFVPRAQQTVRMRGQVLYPTTVQYVKGKSLRYYINQSGGFDTRAVRRKTYVVYANGEVARTRGLILVNIYPKSGAGAEVIVPVKPPKIPVRPGEIATLTTGLAALVAVIVQSVR